MANDDICCLEFNPEPWDENEFEWQNKHFLKGKVKTFFFMPIGFGKVMTELNKLIEANNAKTPDNLCLSDHTSRSNMNVYLATDKEVSGAENITLSGKFLSKVYEGPYQNTGKWTEDFKDYAGKKGLEVKKWYMWYVYCPKCAKKYGKNYTVIIGQI